jgi:superfamily II DNA or RNA helicase
VLVSYPNVSIRQSWFDDASKFDIDISNVVFTTHLSLSKHNPDDFDVVIVDEIHDVSENQWEYLKEFKCIKGLTGTPPKRGSEKAKYMYSFAPIVYEKKLNETVGKTNKDYEIIVHLIQPSDKKDIPLKGGRYWSEKAKIQFFENKYQMSYAFRDMLMLIKSVQGSKTKFDYFPRLVGTMDRALLFLETTEQCDKLPYPSYHSKNSNSEANLERFQSGEVNFLSSISQLKAGITFPNVEKCIILHCYSSNTKTHQRIARCLNYLPDAKATIHIICLDDTRDVEWAKKGLQEFDQSKIKWLKQ